MSKLFRTAAIAALFLTAAACGKTDDGTTEGGRPKLVPEQECARAFQRDQRGGNEPRFVAACKQDMSLVACASGAKGSGFCQRAMADAGKKQIIEDMAAALTTP